MHWSGRANRVLVSGLAAAAVAVPLGCGDDGNGPAQQPAIKVERFEPPEVSGRSFRDLLDDYPGGPALAASVSVLAQGENRFGFGLFGRGNRQFGGADTFVYVARGPDEMAHGPFRAHYREIEVEPEFRSRNTSEDPDSARAVYVAEVDFPRAGTYLVSAIAVLESGPVVAQPAQVRVGGATAVPDVGDRAVRVHTPTVESVGGAIDRIETRVPPDTMHEVDLADALDRGRPVVLLFSSPALCESRVCGPVTDVAEQVKSEFEDDVDFIHVEFYEDNDLRKGPRPAARAWGLDVEPFLFAIDSDGRVAARLQGAFSADELRAAVHKALR
jgi:hypothetical protein